MDLASIEDFRALGDIAKRSAPTSRVNSGAYAAGSIPSFMVSGSHASQSSTPGTVTPQAHPSSPTFSPSLIPLKETRFYKRALTEDIEPTLRLDTAPGLSWLVRRSVISSIVEGSLVVEPMPSSTKMFIYPCSLCGESRREESFRRTHRFRTNESDSAQRYPLCVYCLNRLRATCDYISFLRMVKDGHWRTDTAETEKAAWEESVRLRERMFWARIGGGVVPNFMHRESPRASAEGEKPQTPYSAPPQMHNGAYPSTEQRKELPAVDRGSGLGGIDQRLASYVAHQKPGEHSETESSSKEEPEEVSPSTHEKKLPPPPKEVDQPTTISAARSETSSPNNDQGLQITIPGGFN